MQNFAVEQFKKSRNMQNVAVEKLKKSLSIDINAQLT